ncbi:MAG: aminotransferase class III-fold pyridoxal phosphate-dependent enzyme, partial [Gammaproteobacteria bacterium]|nr:aminotransferase class III-fold pyridoxal phosphate-dependent enzyme [Gammaproteobacteria bacterium]
MTGNQSLQDRRSASVAQGVASAHPFYAARAENAELWDVEGNRYLDFAVGIAVCNTGHCHPKIMAAARAQCDLFTSTASFLSVTRSSRASLGLARCSPSNTAASSPTSSRLPKLLRV